MNKLLVGLMLMAVTALPVSAATKSHKKAAENLLTASGLATSMDRMVVQMVDLQLKQKPAMMPYRDIMLSFFNKYLGYKNIKADFIDIYTSEFTEKELKEITAFYNSPIGKKTIGKMPALMNKGAQMGMNKVRAHMPELRDMIQAEARKNAEAAAAAESASKPKAPAESAKKP